MYLCMYVCVYITLPTYIFPYPFSPSFPTPPTHPPTKIGICTGINQCTCAKGWTGNDCLIPLCAQECQNNGYCIAPDTCKCNQWPNKYLDGRCVYVVYVYNKRIVLNLYIYFLDEKLC